MDAHRIEPWGVTWGRRGVSLTALFGLGTAAWLASPVVLAAAAAFDTLFDRRGPRVRMVAMILAYVTLEMVGVIAAFWVWARGGSATRFVAANAALQRWWTSRMFAAAQAILGFRVVLDPSSDSPVPGPFLLFVRHTSTADTVLAAALVANPHRILLRYALKRELLWDPCLDIVGRRLPNAFVDRSGTRSEAEIRAIAALGRGLDAHSAALIYPEGTRFSPIKLEQARQRLRDRGQAAWAERFSAVLPPRTGGPLALIHSAPGTDILVLEHVGFEAAATFGDLWRGGFIGRTVHARIRRIPASTIPGEDRAEWLYHTWAEVDAWVRSVDPAGPQLPL